MLKRQNYKQHCALSSYDDDRQRWAKLLVTSDRATHGHPTKSVESSFDLAKSKNTEICENSDFSTAYVGWAEARGGVSACA